MSENPAAFPKPPTGNTESNGQPGMTLLDWFAGQALAGVNMLQFGFGTKAIPANPWGWAAGEAYRAADAMLRERQKRIDGEHHDAMIAERERRMKP